MQKIKECNKMIYTCFVKMNQQQAIVNSGNGLTLLRS